MGEIAEQYKDSSNFVARVELNRKFRTNPQPLTAWLFDQMDINERSRILELGCGNAIFWRTNQDKIGSKQRIVLTDISMGMLEDARKVLGKLKDRFEYRVMDAQDVTYPENSFDLAMANLMLYHVPNRAKTFSEITRVLTENGSFYASTFGKNNMKELNELIQDIYPRLNSLENLSKEFGLENGKAQLENYFKQVKMEKYPDHLEITDSQPVIDYFTSFAGSRSVLIPEKIEQLKSYIDEIIEDEGSMKVTKETGVFIATDPIK